MATVNELKLRMRAHVECHLRDFRDPVLGRSDPEFYKNIAYGAVWAASAVDAITDKERDAYLKELIPLRIAA